MIIIYYGFTTTLGRRRSHGYGINDALPGDNPVYELDGNTTTAITLGNPSAQVQDTNQSLNRARIRSESAPDREFDNPIYGKDERENVYSDPDTNQIGTGTGSTPYHKFENPLYGDVADDSAYSVLSTAMANEVYENISRDVPQCHALTASSELVYNQINAV